jgi:hypothetical protein
MRAPGGTIAAVSPIWLHARDCETSTHAVDAAKTAKTEETAGEALVASKTHGFGTRERRAQDPLQIAHERASTRDR